MATTDRERDGTGREASLYPLVDRWLMQSRFNCFASAIEVGLKFGRVDVVGIGDSGKDLAAREELIAIEVKPNVGRFAASVGQAFGYSVYAERCFLACDFRSLARTGFTDEEKEIATQLGVGLLEIGARGKIVEVLPSKRHEPIEGLRLEVIEKLHYSLCAICRSLFQSGKPDKRFSEIVRLTGRSRRSTVSQAVSQERGVMYWLGEASERDPRQRSLDWRRRYVCKDCLSALFDEFPRA